MNARIASGILLLLVACSPVSPPDSAPPPSSDLPSEFRELELAASKIQSMAFSPLLVVAEAGVVARAMRRGEPQTAAQIDGYQLVAWSDNDYAYSWTLECWRGYPAFPGSGLYEACNGANSPDVAMDTDLLIDATWKLIKSMTRQDGYKLIHANLERDMLWDELELQNYRIFFEDPSGVLWYWQWAKLAGFGETDDGTI